MHITLEADYAVRIVTCLAKYNRRLDAKTISEKSCVTLRFALKILRKLVENGIAKSFKGATGGYELAKPANQITLRDVIETVEGTYYFSRCLNENHPPCSQSCQCQYQTAFNEITETVREKLESYTFDMFIK
jgi:Rrf2 family protein